MGVILLPPLFEEIIVPTKEITIVGTTSDGYFGTNNSTDYDTVRDELEAAASLMWFSQTNVDIGQGYFSSPPWVYQIWRGALMFLTTSLAGLSIITAKIRIHVSSYVGVAQQDIVVTNGQPTYPHDPVVKEDYDRLLYSGDGGRARYDDLGTPPYFHDIVLNSTGRGWINKAGTTKFFLRASKDVDGTPPTEWEYWRFDAVEHATAANRPRLIVGVPL